MKKEQIKELRVKIDGLAQLVKTSNTECVGGSKEMDRCYDSLIFAKAWLGKVLQELNESTPYANDGNRKTVKDIEPTADVQVWTYFNDGFKDKNHIEKVDWLRQEIQTVYKQWESMFLIKSKMSTVLSFEQHIQEARFWLGFELQRIRESSGSNI
jgi:hypothetical protein